MLPGSELFDVGLDVLREHAFDVLSGGGLVLCGWLFGRRRALRDWQRQHFLDRVNISLTTLQHGRLLVRTLAEKPCTDVFRNLEAVRKVTAAAKATTSADPLLPLTRDEYWSYLNSVANEVSALCAGGFIAADLGAAVHSGTYVVCLTSEQAAEVRTRKIRVLVVRRETLLSLPAEMPSLAREQDAVRWSTLQALAAEYGRAPWRFLDIELTA